MFRFLFLIYGIIIVSSAIIIFNSNSSISDYISIINNILWILCFFSYFLFFWFCGLPLYHLFLSLYFSLVHLDSFLSSFYFVYCLFLIIIFFRSLFIGNIIIISFKFKLKKIHLYFYFILNNYFIK